MLYAMVVVKNRPKPHCLLPRATLSARMRMDNNVHKESTATTSASGTGTRFRYEKFRSQRVTDRDKSSSLRPPERAVHDALSRLSQFLPKTRRCSARLVTMGEVRPPSSPSFSSTTRTDPHCHISTANPSLSTAPRCVPSISYRHPSPQQHVRRRHVPGRLLTRSMSTWGVISGLWRPESRAQRECSPRPKSETHPGEEQVHKATSDAGGAQANAGSRSLLEERSNKGVSGGAEAYGHCRGDAEREPCSQGATTALVFPYQVDWRRG